MRTKLKAVFGIEQLGVEKQLIDSDLPTGSDFEQSEDANNSDNAGSQLHEHLAGCR